MRGQVLESLSYCRHLIRFASLTTFRPFWPSAISPHRGESPLKGKALVRCRLSKASTQGEAFSCCAYTGVPAFKTTYPHLCRYLCKTPGTSIWKAPEFLCFMRFSGWFVEKLLFHVAHNSDVNLVQLLGISDSPAQWAGLILFISTARAE